MSARHDRPASAPEAGFTLLEVVIALTIAVGTIALGVTLYQTVGRATQGARNAEHDWVTEQFLRRQAEAADPALAARFALVRQQGESFAFVTRRSARFGEDGPPVLALWRYDPPTASLRYREAALPAWWPEDRPTLVVDYAELADATDREVWEGRIFSDIARLQFSYWNERQQTWNTEDSDHTVLAPIVRLTIARADGEKVYAFETRGASSSSSSSGSSPAAQ